FDIALSSEIDIAGFVEKLNFRPRKCLGWKSPHEVFFNQSLHLT
ncbi:MAG: IS30 family transposase, partial [Peptococcaceae bacterium]|nr:IS30 family transposase [Peptococcaceae bacterium]MEA4892717.1 IS30 family transposase [Peptococcaceae bacterium]MEA4892738.1 IS30 family transposase [Peptococcaceae bacterium]